MSKFKLLGISIQNNSVENILYTLLKNIPSKEFFHIVSINPEIIVEAHNNVLFKNIVNTAQVNIIDGVGVVLTIQALFGKSTNRVTGVDLMETLLKITGKNSLRAVLIGGTANLALNIAKCYQNMYPKAKFVGLQAIKNIKNPTHEEMRHVSSIVTDIKPHFVFIAFGSPYQETWLWNNRTIFSNSICMGVGQGFDILGGRVKRAPVWIRNSGFEWLYRLLTQPWRLKRQLKLPLFIFLVIKEHIYERLLHKKS